MQTLVTVVHVVTCFFIVVLVLIQSGKGAEISASLGGSSQTVFGSSGGANFFTRLTSAMAAIFMCTSIVLTLMATGSKKSLFEGAPPAPAAPVTTTTTQKPAAQTPVGGAPAGSNAAAPAQPAAPAAKK